MWVLGEYYKPQKCKECDHSDICDIIELPSEEVCESIRTYDKDFLYEKIWESLDEYFVKGGL